MALTAYLAATNRLLQNPVPANPLYSAADLTIYINEGRQQLAGDAECIRASSAAALVANQQQYLFSLFTVFTSGNTALTGIASALTIRQLSVESGAGYKMVTARSWPWFNRYFIATGAALTPGSPTDWSQQGRGSKGSFALGPPPSAALGIRVDLACLPVDLASDATPESIPFPFTDAIPYYAAYKAYLSSQKTQDATTMFGRYTQFVQRAMQETAGTVFPENQPGGIGARLAGTKGPLTQAPPQGGR